jgi:hypothetical protein
LFASPAQACRLHAIWHYPFRQRCPVVYAMASRPKPARPPSPVQPAVLRSEETIPLPDLGDIEWGHMADEETIGRVLLRAQIEGLSPKPKGGS